MWGVKRSMSVEKRIPVPKSLRKKDVQKSFGHFLLNHGFIARSQLLKALQMQDQHPGVKLGECIAALKIIPYSRVLTLLKLMKSNS